MDPGLILTILGLAALTTLLFVSARWSWTDLAAPPVDQLVRVSSLGALIREQVNSDRATGEQSPNVLSRLQELFSQVPSGVTPLVDASALIGNLGPQLLRGEELAGENKGLVVESENSIEGILNSASDGSSAECYARIVELLRAIRPLSDSSAAKTNLNAFIRDLDAASEELASSPGSSRDTLKTWWEAWRNSVDLIPAVDLPIAMAAIRSCWHLFDDSIAYVSSDAHSQDLAQVQALIEEGSELLHSPLDANRRIRYLAKVRGWLHQ